MPKPSSSVDFFYSQGLFSQGLSRGVLSWLVFRQSMSTDHWVGSARSLIGADSVAERKDHAALALWLRAQPSHTVVDVVGGWQVGVVGAFFGVLAMAGACSYSGSDPVNLWLLLTLFAILPLLFTVFACVSWRSALRASTGSLPVLSQLLFRPILKRLPISTLSADGEHMTGHKSALLKPWLLWKLQWLSVAFQLSALVTFYLMALFQDLAFAWSSTVVADSGWMVSLLQAIAWPWQWLLPQPSIELIENSQHYRGSHFDSQLLGQWWSYIAMAIIAYGLLPRLLLTLWMRYRVGQLLLNELHSSGDIEYFFNAVHRTTEAGKECGESNTEATRKLSQLQQQDDIVYIAWQWTPKHIPTARTLGLERWNDDEQYIKAQAPDWNGTITFLVTLAQTPTAELADILALIKSCNGELQIELSVVEGDPAVTGHEHDGVYESWQLFALKHTVPITLLQIKSPQPTPLQSEPEQGND